MHMLSTGIHHYKCLYVLVVAGFSLFQGDFQ
jgi:hypothetical protein